MKRAYALLLVAAFGTMHTANADWQTMDTSSGVIQVQSKLLGVTGYSVLDTARTRNAINERFLTKHDLTPRKLGGRTGIRGVVDPKAGRFIEEKATPKYAPLPVNIFGETVKFSGLRGVKHIDANVQLILGTNFFRSFVFQFDYPQQRIRLLDRKSVKLKEMKNIDSRKVYKNGPTIVRVDFKNGADAWVVLDTGYTGGLQLEREFVRHKGWLGATPEHEDAPGGEAVVQIPALQFGPYELANVSVATFARGEKHAFFDEGTTTGSHIPQTSARAVGFVGTEVLKHFVITLDHRGGHVHVATKAAS